MSGRAHATPRGIWLRGLIVWACLMALLGLTCLAAYAPFGAWTLTVNLAIAVTQAGLVAALFMHLDRADALVRLTALCGLFWLAILFVLTLADTLSRLANA